MKAVLLLILALVGACGQSDDAPKEPVWGKQPCENCAMLLSEKAHGGQLVTVEGERLYFDDLGCMVAWTDAHPQLARRQWVRTADTQAWLPLAQAGFAPAKHTPMDFGFIATANPGSVSWQQVTDAVRQKLRAK
jgi:copper chaperone NosL